jgi:penicillin-binding protein 1B
MALGLPAIVDTWQKLGVPKDQLHPVPAMILGALNLTPIEVAQAFQTIASGGNRAPLSALRSVIAEDGPCCIRASRRRSVRFLRRRPI